MLPGPPSSATEIASGFQTGFFLWGLLSRPFPLPTVYSDSASRVASCSQAQPRAPAQRTGKKSAEAIAAWENVCTDVDGAGRSGWGREEWELPGMMPPRDTPEAWMSLLSRQCLGTWRGR